jgi:hypothetical protein
MAVPQDPKDNDIQVQHPDPRPVLSVRASVPVAELASAQGEALRALWHHLQHHGGRPSGPPYVRYHRFGEAETDMEVGIPVAAGAVGQGRVAAGELPGGTVVSALAPGRPRSPGGRLRGRAGLAQGARPPASRPGLGGLPLDRPGPGARPRRLADPGELAHPAGPADPVRRGSSMATQATAEVFLARLEARTAPVEREQLQRSFQPAKVATAPPTSSLGCAWAMSSRWPRSSSTCRPIRSTTCGGVGSSRGSLGGRSSRRSSLGAAVGRSSRSLSWLSCFRRLQVRWDRDSGRWFAFVLVACAVVCFNRL